LKRSNYNEGLIELASGRYRAYGFPPMTGLLLDKWIEVTEINSPGCYGPADLDIASTIPNLSYIEDEAGRVIWRAAPQ
jgi:hypothetical protein